MTPQTFVYKSVCFLSSHPTRKSWTTCNTALLWFSHMSLFSCYDNWQKLYCPQTSAPFICAQKVAENDKGEKSNLSLNVHINRQNKAKTVSEFGPGLWNVLFFRPNTGKHKWQTIQFSVNNLSQKNCVVVRICSLFLCFVCCCFEDFCVHQTLGFVPTFYTQTTIQIHQIWSYI